MEGGGSPNTHLCQTPSGPSLRGSPGCPCAPSPSRRWSAAGRAASAGAAALFPKSPSGADSSGPCPPVSGGGGREAGVGGGNVSGFPLNKDMSVGVVASQVVGQAGAGGAHDHQTVIQMSNNEQ